MMQNVLFYLPRDGGLKVEVMSALKPFLAAPNRQVYGRLNDLLSRLQQPLGDISLAVFVAATHQELISIFMLREFLLDLRLILVLPDWNESTVALGRTLYPRFMTYADGSRDEIIEVLRKCLSPGVKTL
ncbi:MAG: hypothetical protein HQK56_03500 [Deltaproteobacteria bacterium]|nr:hypothetical protein [Deltaproteobacteria bacterium]